MSPSSAAPIDQALAEVFMKADYVEALLNQRLEFHLGESRQLLPNLEATYDQLVARIAANVRSCSISA
ncbi:MAG TPA: hypothetical protein VED02_06805 [Methyloceanibacter sp.]|nr:hypothetical protein [Methyloceanibacter sp.]